LINGLTNEATWLALRSRLLLLAADDTDPVASLRDTAQLRELDSALIVLPSSTGGSTTPAFATRPRRWRGCPASQPASPQIPTGDPI
jgi:hypothetical protein